MPHFLSRLEATRPEMPNSPTDQEAEVIGRHFNYLLAASQEGKVLLAGRTVTEPIFGICLFIADDMDAALEFANNDPAVREGVMRLAAVQPYGLAIWNEEYQP